MKKLFALVMMICILIIMAGCTPSDSGSSSEPDSPETASTKYLGFMKREDVKTFLDGEWKMVPGSPGMNSDKKLFFEKDSNSFTFTDMEDGTLAQGTIAVSQINSSLSTFDAITFTIENYSTGDSYKEQGYTSVGGETFQLIARQVEGKDVLALIEKGKVESRIGRYAFMGNMRSKENFFIFERDSLETTTDDGWRPIDSGFYAFLWKSGFNECYLQPVIYSSYSETIDGAETYVVSIAPCDGPLPYRAVKFNVNVGEDLYEYDIPDGGNNNYIPRLVWVETDERGYVKVMLRLKYLGDGKYLAVTGAGSEYRDPAEFRSHDRMLIGRWEMDGEEETYIEINSDSPQVGGYRVDFGFYRRGTGYGYANLVGNSLYINQGEFNGGTFNGYLTPDGNKLVLSITYSSDINVRTGDEYEYVRASVG